MSFKQLKNIDKRTKYTVYGWMRNEENQLKLSCIPSMVTSICILYFRKDEIFEIVQVEYERSDDKKCIKRSSEALTTGWSSPVNFGSILIPSNNPVIYEWILRIANPEKEKYGIEVGISSKPIGDNIYSFRNWGEIRDQKGSKYGNEDAINNGEIIIHLDLKKGEIGFSINGINQGVAYSNIEQSDNINYRLFASMCHKGGKVEIVKFQER